MAVDPLEEESPESVPRPTRPRIVRPPIEGLVAPSVIERRTNDQRPAVNRAWMRALPVPSIDCTLLVSNHVYQTHCARLLPTECSLDLREQRWAELLRDLTLELILAYQKKRAAKRPEHELDWLERSRFPTEAEANRAITKAVTARWAAISPWFTDTKPELFHLVAQAKEINPGNFTFDRPDNLVCKHVAANDQFGFGLRYGELMSYLSSGTLPTLPADGVETKHLAHGVKVVIERIDRTTVEARKQAGEIPSDFFLPAKYHSALLVKSAFPYRPSASELNRVGV